MQIFELHFNPKIKEDRFFESFVYEPSSAYEKNLGSLYIVGELNNAFSQNSNFLGNMAQALKKKFYTLSFKNQNKALTETIKKANDFLANELKKDNASWMGNLNLAILALRDYSLFFTSTGNLKILLLRNGEINDIGKNIKSGEIEPYPLKVFLNLVSGKLMEGDIIIALSKEVFDFFSEEGILLKIAGSKEISDKKLREILPMKLLDSERGQTTSGICFLAYLKEEKKNDGLYQSLGKKAKGLIFKKSQLTFAQNVFRKISKVISFVLKILVPTFKKSFIWAKNNLKTIKLPNLSSYFKKISEKASFGANKKENVLEDNPEENSKRIKIPVLSHDEKEAAALSAPKIKGKIRIKIPKFKFPKISFGPIILFLKQKETRQKIALISFLILILAIGFFYSRWSKKSQATEIQSPLIKIEENIKNAQQLIKNKDDEKAVILLKEALIQISVFANIENPDPKAVELKNLAQKSLEKLSKLENIENPEVLADLNSKNLSFVPQNISLSKGIFYIANPLSKKIFSFNPSSSGSGNELAYDNNIALSDDSSDNVLFLINSKEILYIKDGKIENKDINELEFSPDSFASYLFSLYILDSKANEIIKCAYLGNFKWKNAQFSFKPRSVAKSIAIDGYVWILTKDNAIEGYYKGEMQKSFSLDIFPAPDNFIKIKTKSSAPYLYISEQKNNRIIIVSKEGKIVKQLYSSKFNNIRDFTISNNGSLIYILNDSKIYKISI